MRKFIDLPPTHAAPQHWKEARQRVARLTDALNSESIIFAILPRLQDAFDAGDHLPRAEELRSKVSELDAGLRTLLEASPHNEQSEDGVVQRLTTMAVARFLVKSPADWKRIAAITELEHDVDWPYLSECFAIELRDRSEWVAKTLAATLTVEAKGSDDDHDLLQSELANWQTERKKQVPRWRQGNLLPMGIRDWLLIGKLLMAVDEAAWLRFLDKQELPSAVETLLWQAGLDDAPVKVLQLIEKSEMAFDASGSRTASVAVYFAVEKALDLIQKDIARYEPGGISGRNSKVELAEQDGLLRELVAVLAMRGDSTPLLAELGAEYLVRAQMATPEFRVMRTRFEIYKRFASIINEALGSSESALALVRQREKQPRMTKWGLWLLAADSACSTKAIERGAELADIRRELWSWLLELMASSDPSLVERHSEFPEWVTQLTGFNLAKLLVPTAAMQEGWRILASQRQERLENKYAKDTWRTSKLVCRSGFLAARMLARDNSSETSLLWELSMKIAISAWYSSSNGDDVAAIEYGLCHLAAGAIPVLGEPARTLAHLRGEPEFVTRAVLALRNNGANVRDILQAASGDGIDVVRHMELVDDRSLFPDFDRELTCFKNPGD